MNYGILTLVPIAIVIILALLTKRTLEPLIAGTVVAYMIIGGWSFPTAWMEAFFDVASNRDHQWVFMVCALFGSLIALLGASHGTLGFSKFLEKLCRGPKTTLLVTWVMGILIFVDDYLNIMTLSTSMRKLTDHHKVPREALPYIIDSTGAPVCALLPFSTWAIFFSGLFFSEDGIPELGYGSAIETFYHIIPFVFYAIFAVIIVPLFSFGLLPKLGRMRKAYNRVRTTGQTYSPESRDLNLEDEEEDNPSSRITGNVLDFVLPIGVLIVLAMCQGELFLAVVASILTCMMLYIPRKKLSPARSFDLAMHGFCNMIPTIAIIFFCVRDAGGHERYWHCRLRHPCGSTNDECPGIYHGHFPAGGGSELQHRQRLGHPRYCNAHYYATLLFHRCESAAYHGRHYLWRGAGQSRLFLF